MSKYRITGYKRNFTEGATIQIARINIVAAGHVTLVDDDGNERTFTDPSDETMEIIRELVKGK